MSSFWRPDNDKRAKRVNQISAQAVDLNETFKNNLDSLYAASERLSQVVEKLGNQHTADVPSIPHYRDVLFQPLPDHSKAGQVVTMGKWMLSAYGAALAFKATASWTQPGLRSSLRIIALSNLTRNVGPRQAFHFAAEEVETAIRAIPFWTKAAVTGKQGLRWLGRLLTTTAAGAAINFIVDALFSLWSDETNYSDLVVAIKDATKQRLMQQLSNSQAVRFKDLLVKYQGKAETMIELMPDGVNDKALQKFWTDFMNEVKQTPEVRVDDAAKTLADSDKKLSAYTTDDPSLDSYKQDVIKTLNDNEKYSALKSIAFTHGDVVDSLICTAESGYQYMQYGNPKNGSAQTITFAPSEQVKSVSWVPLSYNGSNAICQLKIVTTVTTYGPFGSRTGSGSTVTVAPPQDSQVLCLVGQKEFEGSVDDNGEFQITAVPFVDDILLCGAPTVTFQ